MKSIVKVIAPLAVAFSAFSANAGITEIDYPVDMVRSHSSAPTASGGADQLWLIQQSQGAAQAVDTKAPRSRDDVRREAQQPRSFEIGYFA